MIPEEKGTESFDMDSKSSVRVGRDSHNNLVLPDDTVSDFHFRLVRDTNL